MFRNLYSLTDILSCYSQHVSVTTDVNLRIHPPEASPV